jgi:PEP-CTERM motif
VAQCPAFGVATDCTTLITVGPGGTLTAVAGPGGTTYDGSDDQLVGFTNNSSSPISSIFLNGNGVDIFGFDGDGIDTFGAPGSDPTGYGGPDSTFSGLSPDGTMGTVDFTTPIAPGGFTYFSLEEPFTAGSITGNPGTSATPEPSTLLLFGTGALGLAARFRSRFSRAGK